MHKPLSTAPPRKSPRVPGIGAWLTLAGAILLAGSWYYEHQILDPIREWQTAAGVTDLDQTVLDGQVGYFVPLFYREVRAAEPDTAFALQMGGRAVHALSLQFFVARTAVYPESLSWADRERAVIDTLVRRFAAAKRLDLMYGLVRVTENQLFYRGTELKLTTRFGLRESATKRSAVNWWVFCMYLVGAALTAFGVFVTDASSRRRT